MDFLVIQPPTPKRKRGGQPGNQNGAKHTQDPKPKTEKAKTAKKSCAPIGNQNARTHGFRELCAPEPPEQALCEVEREGYSSLPMKKRGAPIGNQNARTHGFYARRISDRQLEGLEETTVNSLEDEIGVMRVFSRKVAELGAEVDDLDEAKSVLNTLANATGSINRLVRTHTRIPDPALDPAALLRQSLLELEEEWPELKQFGDHFRTPKQIKEVDDRIAAKAAARALREQQEKEAALEEEQSAQTPPDL